MKNFNFEYLKLTTLWMLSFFLSQALVGQSNYSKPNLSLAGEVEKMSSILDEALNEELSRNHIPGAALVVVQDGKTIYKKGYGIADVNKGNAVDPDRTVFRIGSISKALTLLTLTKLIDQGKISMEEDISRYIDGIQNPHGFTTPITMYNLLTHTTGLDQIGIGRHIREHNLPLSERVSMRPKLKDFLADGNMRRVSEPGAYYRYDTYGTSAAGAVIEMVTGKYFSEAMREELFLPLGMKDSYVGPNPEIVENMAVGHGYINSDYDVMPYEVYKTMPASSIDATAADMGRLLEALTGNGSNDHGLLFSPEMKEQVMKGLFKPHPQMVGMSYGLAESEYIGVRPEAYKLRTLGHGGDMLGFKSHMIVIPSMDIGIYIVANRNRESGGGNVNLWRVIMGAFMEYLGHDYVDQTFDIPSDPPSIDLSPYVGKYYNGIHCHSCTSEEYTNGGWRPRSPTEVMIDGTSLKIGEEEYIPYDESLFVRMDGLEQVFFGKNKNGDITHFNRTDGLSSFEKWVYPETLGMGLMERMRNQGIEEASEWFEKVKNDEAYSLDHGNLTYTAYSLYNNGEYEQARAIFEMIQNEFSHLDEAVNTGVIVDLTEHLSGLELYSEAHAYADFLLTHYNTHERAWRSKAQIFLLEKKYEKAMEYHRKAAQLNSRTNLFQIAFTPGQAYKATDLSADTTSLYRIEGDAKLDTVFIYVQGGPMLNLGTGNSDPLQKLPNHHRYLKVYTYQTQMLNPALAVTSPPMNNDQAMHEMKQNSEILHRTIRYYKNRGKAVYVIGHSFGLSISMDYLSRYGNEADHLFMMGGHFNADLRNFDRKPGMFVRWKDGEVPYLRNFYGGIDENFPMKKDLDNVFENIDALVHYPRLRRFTEELKFTDLSRVSYVHARFEEASGQSSEEELAFAEEKGMSVLESFGDHHSMLSPRYLRSIYNHVLRKKPLKKSVASQLLKDINNRGMDEAMKKSDSYITSSEFMSPHEQEINQLGYYLISKKRVEEACQVFELNVRLFPHSWNVYDSLGEAYLELKNEKQSIKNYKKSLELNPENQYAIDALKKMEAE